MECPGFHRLYALQPMASFVSVAKLFHIWGKENSHYQLANAFPKMIPFFVS